MTTFTATVHINIKPAVLNPEEKVVKKALHDLEFKTVSDIKMGKCHKIVFDAGSRDEALTLVEQMCRRLLANQVTEVFSIQSLVEIH